MKGWYWKRDISGQHRKMYWPARAFRLIFFDLYLDDVTRVLYNFRDKGSVPASDFSGDAFEQVDKAAEDPPLPEYSGASRRTERRIVLFDHAKRSVYGEE